jgi:hypothetical protein
MDVLGERTLVEYGIQTEESDYRAHVCFAVGIVYVFPTQSGKDAALSGKYPLRSASQRTLRYATAEGYTVPPEKIKSCVGIEIPNDLLGSLCPERYDDESTKGEQAVETFRRMCLRGLVSLPLLASDVTSRQGQIQGKDIVITSDVSVQVKCDYFGGPKNLGGTGNLFLQVRECNPFGMH